MNEHWYESENLTVILTLIAFVAMIVGNYYIHGGHIAW